MVPWSLLMVDENVCVLQNTQFYTAPDEYNINDEHKISIGTG